jgi:hypothetical protein
MKTVKYLKTIKTKLCSKNVALNSKGKLLIIPAVLAGITGGSQLAQAQFSALWPATQFGVLTYNTPNNSSGAFNVGPLGVVNGEWKQSGGDSSQQANTVVVSSASDESIQGGGPGNVTYSFSVNPTLLNSAWTAAQTASAAFAAESTTPGLAEGSINNQNVNITESAVGNYVVSFNNISFNQNELTLSAPAGSTFLVNITGTVSLNGGSPGNGFVVAGGLTAGDVIYNFTDNTGNVIQTSGGGNAQVIDGTILAPLSNQSVQFSPAGINGELIATSVQTSSGAGVNYSPVPVPEPTALAWGGFGGLAALLIARRRK